MIRFEEALDIVKQHAFPDRTERIPLRIAAGRSLAEDVAAPFPIPRFDNSAMDGYAVGSTAGPWTICGKVQAGDPSELQITPDSASRIFTGAPVPMGAVAVIPQEDSHLEHGRLCADAGVSVGQHIRRAGEEIAEGAQVLRTGCRITAPIIGVLAGLGIAEVSVNVRPRVAILATGNELSDPGEPLGPAGIYQSNSWGIRADMESLGMTVDVQKVRDDCEATAVAMADLLEQCDLLITIGGISVGDHDHVKRAATSLGADTLFSGVKIKPGKPVTFGVLPNGKRWFGLPGNPMSAWLTYLLFVRSIWGEGPQFRTAIVRNCLSRKPGREEFMPCRFDSKRAGVVELLPNVGSHAIAALSNAEAIARIDAEAELIHAGSEIDVFMLPGGMR